MNDASAVEELIVRLGYSHIAVEQLPVSALSTPSCATYVMQYGSCKLNLIHVRSVNVPHNLPALYTRPQRPACYNFLSVCGNY